MGYAAAIEKTGAQEKRPNATITISEEPLRFREPRTTDLEMQSDTANMLTADFPTLTESRKREVAIIGAYYLPNAGEGDINPTKMTAQLATKNEYVYVDLRDQFFAAFPEFVNWLAAKAQAKNASEQQNETPSSTASAT